MARTNPRKQAYYTCHDCLAKVGIHPFRWQLGDGFWIPLCAGCHFTRFQLARAYTQAELEVEQGLAVAVAREIVRLHSYELDQGVQP